MSDQEKSQSTPLKRKRVTKACLICAKSRRKCDGVQPFCGTCRTQGTQCAWSDIPTRRGPPKGYRRGNADPLSLIPKIGKIREHIQALQVAYGEQVVLEELHNSLFGSRTCETYSGSSDASRGATSNLTSAVPGPGPSTMAALGMNTGIVGGSASSDNSTHSPHKAKSELSQDEQDDRSNSDIEEGSSSGLRFLASSMRYMHTGTQSSAGPLTPVSDGERLSMDRFSPWAGRDNRVEHHPLIRRKASLENYIPHPSPADVEVLLKTYWSSIHPHWPILYKPTFDAISLFRINSEVPLALLYAMYCLSARLAPTATLNAEAAELFRHVAENELQSEGAFKSDITTCTTLFLLSLYYHGEGDQRQAWVHCGVAAMMALDLGLHKTSMNLPLVEHERRVRVFWNIYVYEKVLAAEMGRPVMIRMVHCDPVRLSEEQSDEYETVVHPGSGMAVRLYTISIFNAAVDLFRIFERILSEVHTIIPQSTSMRSARERLVQELDRDLENWQRALGPRCTYPRPDDRQPTRSLYLTHAWYHIAIILLHRPLITRFRMPFVSNIHHKKATDHANKLVDLLSQFAAGQEIDKLPPNDAFLIFSAAVLHVFNLGLNDKELRDAARPRLERCIEWLRGLAETWSAASQYKVLLDVFARAATDTISHSHSLSPATSTSSSSHQQAMQSVAYQTQPNIPYAMQHSLDYGANNAILNPNMVSQYTGEMEQKLFTPGLFNLEGLYWNDWQHQTAAGQPIVGYYTQEQPELASQASANVFNGVLRLLQEEGRGPLQ